MHGHFPRLGYNLLRMLRGQAGADELGFGVYHRSGRKGADVDLVSVAVNFINMEPQGRIPVGLHIEGLVDQAGTRTPMSNFGDSPVWQRLKRVA